MSVERRIHIKQLAGLFLVFALMLTLCSCGTKDVADTWQEQYDLGVRYLSEGNYEQAILAFTSAIEIDPNITDAYIGRADAYISSGETEVNLAAALADYEMILELDQSNAAAWLGLADVYIRQGSFDKAMEVLQEGLKKCSESVEIADKISEMESGNVSDASGKRRKKTTYDAEGNLVYWHQYAYNEDGKQASLTSFDAAGVQTGHVDYEYDELGRSLTSVWWGTATGAIGKLEYKLDEEGRIVRANCFSLEGELTSYELKEYDPNGRCIKEIDYTSDNMMTGYTLYSFEDEKQTRQVYDADGTLKSYAVFEKEGQYYYDENGKLKSRTMWIFDEQGNIIGSENYDGEGNLKSTTNYS